MKEREFIYKGHTLIPAEENGTWHVVMHSAKLGYKRSADFATRDEAIAGAKSAIDARQQAANSR
jgi:hypothetical protein